MVERVMTVLFGPRCEHGCGLRVYPRAKDRTEHIAKYCRVTAS